MARDGVSQTTLDEFQAKIKRLSAEQTLVPAMLYDLATPDPGRVEINLNNVGREILKNNLLVAIVICARYFSPKL